MAAPAWWCHTGAMDESGPIDPFPRPTWLDVGAPDAGAAASNFNLSDIYPAIFAIVFLVWLLYSLVAAYHWFRYGHRSFLTVPALAIHVVVSGTLMLLATAGLK